MTQADTVTPAPDLTADGMLAVAPDPLRYDGQSREPHEIIDLLQRLIPKHGRVLDIGCGTGVISRIVADACQCEVIGLEPDPLRAAAARGRGLNISVGYATAENLPAIVAVGGKFDVILFLDVLEHCPNPADLLQLAAGCLKPGGSVVASVPNIAHWSVRLNLLFGRFNFTNTGIMDATHLRWFTRRTISELFEHCGYQITARMTSAGAWMQCYRHFPQRFIPYALRAPIVRLANRLMPRLFGCQHVIRATCPANGSRPPA